MLRLRLQDNWTNLLPLAMFTYNLNATKMYLFVANFGYHFNDRNLKMPTPHKDANSLVLNLRSLYRFFDNLNNLV